MNKTTPEEALALAEKHELLPPDIRFYERLAALIDEAVANVPLRRVNVESVTLSALTNERIQEIWKDTPTQGDPTGMKFAVVFARNILNASAPSQPELKVWFGSMPESNGKRNWTVLLKRKIPGKVLSSLGSGICFGRSEYYDQERYRADCLRYIIGELLEPPHILNYDPEIKEPDKKEKL